MPAEETDLDLDFAGLDWETTNNGAPAERTPIEGGDPLVQGPRFDSELTETHKPSGFMKEATAWLDRFEAEERVSAARHALRIQAIGGLVTV